MYKRSKSPATSADPLFHNLVVSGYRLFSAGPHASKPLPRKTSSHFLPLPSFPRGKCLGSAVSAAAEIACGNPARKLPSQKLEKGSATAPSVQIRVHPWLILPLMQAPA